MQQRPGHHFFDFTRKEKNGAIFIIALMLMMVSIPGLMDYFFPVKIPLQADIHKEMASLKIIPADSLQSGNEYAFRKRTEYSYREKMADRYEPMPAPVFFSFDPNTVSAEGWKKMGLRDKTIGTIQHYLSKGGKFRKPEDIKKIWGLPGHLAERMIPFIHIKETVAPVYASRPQFDKRKPMPDFPVNINEADSNALDALPGIGAKLSQRILAFREKLGGFYSVEQVAETFGLPDSTFQQIKGRLVLPKTALRRININTAAMDEMKAHPYIRYKLANAIVQYRSQHGQFSKAEDIKKIMFVDDALFNKLAPYLTVD